MRESWTDERLDEFAVRIDLRFDSLEHRVEDGFRRVNADIRELRAQVASFQRTFMQFSAGMMITFFVGFAGLIATQL